MIPRVRPILDAAILCVISISAFALYAISAALEAFSRRLNDFAFSLNAKASLRRRLLERHRRHLLATERKATGTRVAT